MTYLGSDRFVVRELEGYANPRQHGGGNGLPGLCITVHDRAYCGQVIRMWRTEEHHAGGNGPNTITRDKIRVKFRAEAAAYAANLNAGGRCTGEPLLRSGIDHSSLSPFDSGCPQ